MLGLLGGCKTTKAQTLPDSTVSIPAAAARRIDADLRRYPLVLRENRELRVLSRTYAYAAGRDSVALAAKARLVVLTNERLALAQTLGRDAQRQAIRWQGKARKRGWLNAALAGLLLALTFVSVAR